MIAPEEGSLKPRTKTHSSVLRGPSLCPKSLARAVIEQSSSKVQRALSTTVLHVCGSVELFWNCGRQLEHVARLYIVHAQPRNRGAEEQRAARAWHTIISVNYTVKEYYSLAFACSRLQSLAMAHAL